MTAKEKAPYLTEIAKRVKYETTDDLELLKERQADALKKAAKYRKEIRNTMKEFKAAFESAKEGSNAEQIKATRAEYFKW